MPIKAPMGRRMPNNIVAPPPEVADVLSNPDIVRLRRVYYRNRRRYYAILGKKDHHAIEQKRVPQWDGGHDKANNRTYASSAWAPLLQFITNNQCYNFEGYITAQFQMNAADNKYWRIQEPKHFYNDSAFMNYREYVKDVERSFPKTLITQCNIFDAQQLDTQERMPELSYLECWQHILDNTANDLTPLFRYCVAIAENFTASKELELAAFNQLLFDPINYQTYWKTILPAICLQSVSKLLQIEDSLLASN
jgi:hypothetical protein